MRWVDSPADMLARLLSELHQFYRAVIQGYMFPSFLTQAVDRQMEERRVRALGSRLGELRAARDALLRRRYESILTFPN